LSCIKAEEFESSLVVVRRSLIVLSLDFMRLNILVLEVLVDIHEFSFDIVI